MVQDGGKEDGVVEGGSHLGPWLVAVCQWMPADLGKKMAKSTWATELESKMGHSRKGQLRMA